MTEPMRELNPVLLEHRLTTIENTVLRLPEALGAIETQMRVANGRTAKNEEAIRAESETRRRELEAVDDKFDSITDGIAERIKMEAASKAGFDAGRASITIKMPWGQVFTILGMVVGLLSVIEVGIKMFL